MEDNKKSLDVLVDVKDQNWIRTAWRPMMAWQYFIVCICDFIIFPLIAFWLAHKQGVDWKWEPMTLKDGGFYHMAMGIIVGVSAWQRGQENLLRTKVFGPSIIESETENRRYRQGAEHVEDDTMYIDHVEEDEEELLDPPAHPNP
jgi:hypothetical protein